VSQSTDAATFAAEMTLQIKEVQVFASRLSNVPSARAGAAAAVYGPYFVILGGYDASLAYLNELRLFDMRAVAWVPPFSPLGSPPVGRTLAVLAPFPAAWGGVNASVLLLFGGNSAAGPLSDTFSLRFPSCAPLAAQFGGFAAANAGTATRLTLDMRDVPAAFSMMTRDFIDELGVVNVGEAASWMPNGASVEPQDNVQQPMQYSTRGVNNNSGQQRNNYLTNGLLESYAIERYEFGRGPNADLFNIGAGSSLAGGLGAQTKKARYDRPFETVSYTGGSWDYKRITLDVNRPLTDKLAVRGNAVWFDKGGWRMAQWEKTQGVTAGASTPAFLIDEVCARLEKTA
jgi:hypothetical protein